MKKPVIEFRNVYKKLQKNQVLNNINLEVFPGEVIGIVGQNGSGKTTILRHIAGLIYPDQGEVIVSGRKVFPGLMGNLPVNIGALIEAPIFLPYCSGVRNLEMLANIREIISKKQVRATLELVGLDPDNKKPVKTYSQGMRQRLGIAQAIMENPDILLLDEPTNGLDAQGVQCFKEIISNQVDKGVTVILVSHVQEEIDKLSDKVFVLSNGQLQSLREKKKSSWTVSVKTLEEIEILSQVVPFFQIIDRVNNLPTGICRGDWKDKEEFISFLQSKSVKPLNIKGEDE